MSNYSSLTPVDVTAPTLEQAIQEGLQRLGLSRNDVIIEIVEEGSRGVLGMGARDAVVRLTPLRPPAGAQQPVPADEPPAWEEAVSENVADEVEPVQEAPAWEPPQEQLEVEEEEPFDVEEDEYETYAEDEAYAAGEAYEAYDDKDEDGYAPAERVSVPLAAEDLEREAEIAKAALLELLEKMEIEADVDVYHAEPAPHEDEAPWILDVRGNDLGILIGRHGETLNALQYVTRLIVSRELQRRANIVIDVEGYKARREASLEKLAERMAQKAVQSGRTVTLDPMPPNERRVIHVALRQDPRVETESTGTGNSRRVTIIPTRSAGR